MSGAQGWTIRPADEDDLPRIRQIRSVSLNRPSNANALLPGLWVAADERGPLACARLESDGQWFAGRALSTALISSVAVAPEARGRGVGSSLLRSLLLEARDLGLAASSLYPSAIRPYRRAGFEVAGACLPVRIDLAGIVDLGPTGEIAPLSDEALPALMRHYGRLASRTEGAIARSEAWWRARILSHDPPVPNDGEDVHAYVAVGPDGIAGHVVFTQHAGADDPYVREVVCRSIGWEDRAAGSAILASLSSGRPLVSHIRWPGQVVDPVLELVDSAPTIVSSDPWMTRVLDVRAALDGRICSPITRTAFSLAVTDALLPAWDVVVRVTMEDGLVRAETTDGPGCRIDVGALSAILAGGLHPFDAVAAGRLASDADAIAGLQALIPTGRRWIGDAF